MKCGLPCERIVQILVHREPTLIAPAWSKRPFLFEAERPTFKPTGWKAGSVLTPYCRQFSCRCGQVASFGSVRSLKHPNQLTPLEHFKMLVPLTESSVPSFTAHSFTALGAGFHARRDTHRCLLSCASAGALDPNGGGCGRRGCLSRYSPA
jgi:hypothetical protein